MIVYIGKEMNVDIKLYCRPIGSKVRTTALLKVGHVLVLYYSENSELGVGEEIVPGPGGALRTALSTVYVRFFANPHFN